MKQEEVAEKLMIELVDANIVAQIGTQTLYRALHMAYGAGYDEGRLQYTKRKAVLQFNMAGEFVAEHESATIAARKTGLTKYSISKAALGKIRYAGNFYWRYKEETDGKNQDSR